MPWNIISRWEGCVSPLLRATRLFVVSRLLWFRAFNRRSFQDVLGVLRDGDTPHPDPASRTRQDEVTLGIAPPCVYAYLGMTLELFGKCAVALGFDQLDGHVSPFDSGGLIRHIHPLCDWEVPERQKFLAEYTWSSDQLPDLLKIHPGEGSAEIAAYLDGTQPTEEGFHAVYSESLPEAPMWKDNTDRRAWTWEGRRQGGLPFRELVAWTCPPDQYAEILSLSPTTDDERQLVVWLARQYVRGGVAALLRALRPRQEAA